MGFLFDKEPASRHDRIGKITFMGQQVLQYQSWLTLLNPTETSGNAVSTLGLRITSSIVAPNFHKSSLVSKTLLWDIN